VGEREGVGRWDRRMSIGFGRDAGSRWPDVSSHRCFSTLNGLKVAPTTTFAFAKRIFMHSLSRPTRPDASLIIRWYTRGPLSIAIVDSGLENS